MCIKGKGEVLLVGDFSVGVWRVGQPDNITGQYGENKKNTNRVESPTSVRLLSKASTTIHPHLVPASIL